MPAFNELSNLPDNELILPPDVTAAGLRDALKAIAAVVGEANVTVQTLQSMKPDDEGHYYNLPKEHDLFYVLEKDHFLASAVVAPGSTEDVSAVVKIANQYLTPLWPVSIGRNLGKIKHTFCVAVDVLGLLTSSRLRWSCPSPTRQYSLGHGRSDEQGP